MSDKNAVMQPVSDWVAANLQTGNYAELRQRLRSKQLSEAEQQQVRAILRLDPMVVYAFLLLTMVQLGLWAYISS